MDRHLLCTQRRYWNEFTEEEKQRSCAAAQEWEMNRKLLVYLPNFIPEDKATAIYQTLLSQIKWDVSVPQPQYTGLERTFPDIFQYLITVVKNLRRTSTFYPDLSGLIVTYLPNGNYHVFPHEHPGQTELKLSFGGTRPIIVNGREYLMGNGSMILFGPLNHEVPQTTDINPQINIVMYYSSKGNAFIN